MQSHHNCYFSLSSIAGQHCDADYAKHHAAEINIWVPVTSVFESNGLYLESKPSKGDFRPVTLDFGHYLQFYGYGCRHYSTKNDTGATRISFDFRVIPLKDYEDSFQGRIGHYPSAVAHSPRLHGTWQ
jgi:hypothetical protein